MTTDQKFNFLKLLKKILKDEEDLDFRKSEWARDVRKACKDDVAFIRFLVDDAGFVHAKAEEWQRRAKAVGVVSDVSTWNKLGGYEKLQPLVTHDLPRKEQIAIIEAAKVSGYKDRPITRVMQQRGHIQAPAPVRSTAALPVIATPTAREIQVLAAFIDETYKNPPADIRRIVSKYTAKTVVPKETAATARA